MLTQVLLRTADYEAASWPRKVLRHIKHTILAVHNSWHDRKLGIEAAGVLQPDELGSKGPHAGHSHVYIGTPHLCLSIAFWLLRVDPRQFTFVDFGSGKGRVVFRAATYRFLRSVGVELSPLLHKAALENVVRAMAKGSLRTTVDFHHQDALAYELPATPMILFFFNPFDRVVFQGMLKNIDTSLRANPRECHIVYFCPKSGDLFESLPYMRRRPMASWLTKAIDLVSPWSLAIYSYDPNSLKRRQTSQRI